MKRKLFLEQPVFVVGVPRSGTTMLWSILLRHREFRGEKEIKSWNAETSIFHKFPRLLENFFEPGKWPFWNEYFVNDKKRFEEWVTECARNFVIKAAKARRAQRPLEKTPNHLEDLDMIEKAFPLAKIIHIIRHPLDVFASMRKRSFVTAPAHDPWLRVSAKEFANDYKRKVTNALQYKGALAILTVRYEDLTEDAERQVFRVCTFLGIEPDATIIYGAKPVKEIGKFPLRSHVPVYNSGFWYNIVSEKEAATIMRTTKNIRNRYHYE